MWYYDEHGNFVGDEDRPSQDDMGFVFSQREQARITRENNPDEYEYLRNEAKIEKAVEEGNTGTVEDYEDWL